MQGGALGFLLHPKYSKCFFDALGPYASQANTGAEQACNPYAGGCLRIPFAPLKFQIVDGDEVVDGDAGDADDDGDDGDDAGADVAVNDGGGDDGEDGPLR